MALLYGLLYFPYTSQAFPVRALNAYLRGLARAAGLVIGWVDATVQVMGTSIHGRFPLEIVLDCAAVDAQALFVAAVATFPLPWRARVIGVAAGIAAISGANLLRIVALYFIGVRWPGSFHFWHAEVFQLVMVLVAGLTFVAWIAWARARPLGAGGAPGGRQPTGHAA